MSQVRTAPSPEVALVAVNWNGRDDCEAMLESVRAQTYALSELLVVDNGSEDGSKEWFLRQPDVRLIANGRNRGFAVAVNQGLRATGAPLVLLCNLDVVLDREFVALAAARIQMSEDIGGVGGRLRRPHPGPGPGLLDTTGHVLHRSGWVGNRDQGAVDDARHRQPEEVFGLSAAACLYRRRMLQDVALGGEVFCEDLFAYMEDVDLDWRARWRGWRAWYEPRATASHRRGGSGLHATARIERHVVANRITVWARNAPSGWLRGKGLAGALLLFGMRVGRALPRHPTAALGFVDGLRRLPTSLSERQAIMAARKVPAEELARWAQPTPWRRLVLGPRRWLQ
ncbi:MAG: glycosyltransferase family 2 protein [Candidatus Dormibacteria bacterium]